MEGGDTDFLGGRSERAKRRRREPSIIEELLGSEPGFAETRAAIRETVEKIRNETEEERVEREAGYAKYVEAQGLLDALEGGDTVLISARWLLNQERGYVLPKRGELPPEAIISADELRRSYEGRDMTFAEKFFPIIAVSHCWRTKAHPDPEGKTTRMLQAQLETKWELFTGRRKFSDVGIFFDWCSLWQTPRTPEQQECFDRALRAINHWYAHANTYAWLVTDARVPHADGRLLGYADKGWTMFERTLVGMIKARSGSQIKELGGGLGITEETPKPPADPLAFCAGHRYGENVYTNGSDRDRIVAPHFEKATA